MSEDRVPEGLELRIVQFVLEDSRFAHRKDFLALSPQQKVEGVRAELSVEVQTKFKEDEDDKALVRLRATSDQPDAPYSFAVSYIVLIQMRGHRPENLSERLAATGGGFLMPFVREVVANLTGKGRFGPVWLPPVNFNRALNDPKTARTGKAASAK